MMTLHEFRINDLIVLDNLEPEHKEYVTKAIDKIRHTVQDLLDEGSNREIEGYMSAVSQAALIWAGMLGGINNTPFELMTSALLSHYLSGRRAERREESVTKQ